MKKFFILFCLLFFSDVLSSELREWKYSPFTNLSEFSAWWSSQENLDEWLLTEDELNYYNRRARYKGYILDPFDLGDRISAAQVVDYQINDLAYFKQFRKYDASGTRRRDPETSQFFSNNMLWPNRKKAISLRYGVTVRYSEIRRFPTARQYYSEPEDFDFDLLDVSSIDALAPLAILSESKDGQWLFVQSSFARGWIDTKDVAIEEAEKLGDILDLNSIVILEWQAKLQTMEGENYDKVYMGSRLPLLAKDQSNYFVIYPERSENGNAEWNTFQILKSKASENYLDLSKRNVYSQIEKLVGLPYVWGGGKIGLDCSLFLQRIFSTMGLFLPRSSFQQVEVFYKQSFENYTVHKKAKALRPGNTFLYFSGPGHIMLYLGDFEGEALVAHTIYSLPEEGEAEKTRVAQTIVSTANAGLGSPFGSLFERTEYFSHFP